MNRFRVSSTEGSSGTDNPVYYLSGSGAENKRPNIISRQKTKSGTGTVPTTTMQTSQPMQQQQLVFTTSTGQQIQVSESMAMTGSSSAAASSLEAGSVGDDPSSYPIQILDEAASAAFLRSNNVNVGSHQIVTDASGTMTIETEDGNLMVILQNEDDDDSTTTGTIAFGNEIIPMDEANTQIIQNVQFSSEDGTIQVPNMDYGSGENDMPETTSYILVQMDDQGNNILVPASAFSSQVNGIPTLTQVSQPSRTSHQSFTTQLQTVQATTTQHQSFPPQPPQEKGKPFRFVVPEEDVGKMEDGLQQYVLNVVQGPSQPAQPQQQIFTTPTTQKAKAPPKPRKPRPKKVVTKLGDGPLATSTPLPGRASGKVGVVVTQVSTPDSQPSTQPLAGKQIVATAPLSGPIKTFAAATKPTLYVAPLAPAPESPIKTEPVTTGAGQGTVKPEPSEPGGSAVSAALGMIVSTATGPAVPVATEAALTTVGPAQPPTAPTSATAPQTPGPSKPNVIVVAPKPTSSVNGTPKKPTEEIVVTAFGTFKCTFCFKESTVRSHLVNHINRIHKGEKPFKCKVCNIGFQYSSSLKVHEKNHTLEKPYKCEYCECAFATDSNRNLHQKTVHSSPKDSLSLGASPKMRFECGTCQKAFCSKYNLLCHRLTHVDDFTRPIVCDFCKKECKTKAMLVHHVQAHKDAIGPFSCNICEMSFTSESRLEVHKIMHKDKKRGTVKVEPVVESKTPSTASKVNVAQRKNMKISTPTPRRKKLSIPISKEVFCSVCDEVFPTAEALEVHKEKKHGPGSAARTYSKRNPDEYETYIGKVVARKLTEEKPGSSKAKAKVGAGGKKKLEEADNPDDIGEEVPVKRGRGRPKRSDSEAPKVAARRGRPPRSEAKQPGKRVGRKPGPKPKARRGRPAKRRQITVSSSESELSEEETTPERKPPVRVKEASPKEKLAKPIKKRPIRTDPPMSEPSSREPSPLPDTQDDSVRKSSRKRKKNPYLEELKRKRERKIKIRLQRANKKASGDADSTPAKRKRMITVAPKKDEKPSPKKDDEDSKPVAGSGRGGRKRKGTESVVAAAIPKKRPYPKEIQDLLAASSETTKSVSESDPELKPLTPDRKSEGDADNIEPGTSATSKAIEKLKEENKSELLLKAEHPDIVEEMEEIFGEKVDDAETEAGPSKSTEDSGPPTSSSSEGQDDRIDISVPMKKRKVIAERDKNKEEEVVDIDEAEADKSYFQIFKQVKSKDSVPNV